MLQLGVLLLGDVVDRASGLLVLAAQFLGLLLPLLLLVAIRRLACCAVLSCGLC